jgi:hypothetical protein
LGATRCGAPIVVSGSRVSALSPNMPRRPCAQLRSTGNRSRIPPLRGSIRATVLTCAIVVSGSRASVASPSMPQRSGSAFSQEPTLWATHAFDHATARVAHEVRSCSP